MSTNCAGIIIVYELYTFVTDRAWMPSNRSATADGFARAVCLGQQKTTHKYNAQR